MNQQSKSDVEMHDIRPGDLFEMIRSEQYPSEKNVRVIYMGAATLRSTKHPNAVLVIPLAKIKMITKDNFRQVSLTHLCESVDPANLRKVDPSLYNHDFLLKLIKRLFPPVLLTQKTYSHEATEIREATEIEILQQRVSVLENQISAMTTANYSPIAREHFIYRPFFGHKPQPGPGFALGSSPSGFGGLGPSGFGSPSHVYAHSGFGGTPLSACDPGSQPPSQ
jgi:hypothetical protein